LRKIINTIVSNIEFVGKNGIKQEKKKRKEYTDYYSMMSVW